VNPASISAPGCFVTPTNAFTYVCHVTVSPFTVQVTLNTADLSTALELSAIVTSSAGEDCVVDHESIAILNSDADCSIRAPGTYCFDTDTNCWFRGLCPARKRDTTSTVAYFPLSYSVHYRRVKAHGAHVQNTREDKCGPRIAVTVNGVTKYLTAEDRFHSQGVVSFVDTILLRVERSEVIGIDVESVDCRHSKLLVWEQKLLIPNQPGIPFEEEDSVLAAEEFADVRFK
jgi:hypothetical protein